MGWRKHDELIQKIQDLIVVCEHASDDFNRTFTRHLTGTHDGIFSFGVDEIRKYKTESGNCVDTVREILYSSSFPAIRDELMTITRTIHLIIEALAHELYLLRDHSLSSISELSPQFSSLNQCLTGTLTLTTELCRMFIATKVNRSVAKDQISKIVSMKSECTHSADQLTSYLFASKLSDEIKQEHSTLTSTLIQIVYRCQQLTNQIELALLIENE